MSYVMLWYRKLSEGFVGTLYDYVARAYDPALGRFISADTIVPGAGNPAAFNRYSYALNSPIKYGDPSGHDPKDDYGRSMNDDCNYAGVNCLYQENPVVTHYKQVWLRTGTIRSIRDSDWDILAYLVREKKVAAFNFANRLDPVNGPPGRVSFWDVTQYIERYKSPLQPENRPEYHGADYISVSGGGSLPMLGPVGGGVQVSLTFDRYSRVFLSVGLTLGGPLPVSGSAVAGTIGTTNDRPATKEEALAHLSGTSIGVSGGFIFGGGSNKAGPLTADESATSRSDFSGLVSPGIGFGPQLTIAYIEDGLTCVWTPDGYSCH